MLNNRWSVAFWLLTLIALIGERGRVANASEDGTTPVVDQQFAKHVGGSKTDEESITRQQEAASGAHFDSLSSDDIGKIFDKAPSHKFHTQEDRMMKLIINSLYKQKEIFLRELISNASDALDKIRTMSYANSDVLKADSQLSIRIKVDEKNKMLHIIDSGIGMTKKDLEDYLGTIAKSDTSEFLKAAEKGNESEKIVNDLIGQFGVGFYSAFLVADKVVVTSKHNDDVQCIWESDSKEFKVMEDPRPEKIPRGTIVTLHLKEDAEEYLDLYYLKNIVVKYSQFVSYPIYLWNKREVEEEVAQENVDDKQDEEDVKVSDEDKPKEKKVEKIKKTVWYWDHVNDIKPIWRRNPKEVSEEEYNEFYKALTKKSEDPFLHIQFAGEGEVNFRSVVFIPKTVPVQYTGAPAKTDNIKLYVRRVFISDQFEDFLPSYLSFVHGIVDSDDLPLNVSRETLQQHRLLKIIRKALTRKILETLMNLDEEKYIEFWKEFGTQIKLGLTQDQLNRLRLAKLLRFYSSSSTEKYTNLVDYVSRMREGQKDIFYVAASNLGEAKNSPFVEKVIRKGYEVLYFVDTADQYCLNYLREFEGKKFQNVAKEGLQLDTSEKEEKKKEQLQKQYEPLIRYLEEAFSDKVLKVSISDRLVETPMIFVASQWGYDGNMERISLAQAAQKVGGDVATLHFANMKRKMEINPHHPLIKDLLNRVKRDKSDPNLREYAEVSVDVALIRSGYLLRDSTKFTERVENLLKESMHLPINARVDKKELESEEQSEPEESSDVKVMPGMTVMSISKKPPAKRKRSSEICVKKTKKSKRPKQRSAIADKQSKKQRQSAKDKKYRKELTRLDATIQKSPKKIPRKRDVKAQFNQSFIGEDRKQTKKQRTKKVGRSAEAFKASSNVTIRKHTGKRSIDKQKQTNKKSADARIKKRQDNKTRGGISKLKAISKEPEPSKTQTLHQRMLQVWQRFVSAISMNVSGDIEPNNDIRPKKSSGFAMAFEMQEVDSKDVSVKADLPNGVVMRNGKLSVGYKYRYRISNFLRSQEGRVVSKNLRKKLPSIANLSIEEIKDPRSRVIIKKPAVGYAFRYRISNYVKTLTPEDLNDLYAKGYLRPVVVTRGSSGLENNVHIDVISRHDEKPAMVLNHVYQFLINLISHKRCVEWKEVPLTPQTAEPIQRNQLYGKIGYEYRYRLSRKLARLKEKVVETIPKIKPPNVGYVHRYRVSKMLENLNLTYDSMVSLIDDGKWNTVRQEMEVEFMNKHREHEKDNKTEDTDELKLVGTSFPTDITIKIEDLFPAELIKVGYKYRYRRSIKMRALGISRSTIEQKRWALIEEQMRKNVSDLLKKDNRSTLDKTDHKEVEGVFVLDYSRLTPEERKVGYEYRYRISRKFMNQLPLYVLDDIANKSKAKVEKMPSLKARHKRISQTSKSGKKRKKRHRKLSVPLMDKTRLLSVSEVQNVINLMEKFRGKVRKKILEAKKQNVHSRKRKLIIGGIIGEPKQRKSKRSVKGKVNIGNEIHQGSKHNLVNEVDRSKEIPSEIENSTNPESTMSEMSFDLAVEEVQEDNLKSFENYSTNDDTLHDEIIDNLSAPLSENEPLSTQTYITSQTKISEEDLPELLEQRPEEQEKQIVLDEKQEIYPENHKSGTEVIEDQASLDSPQEESNDEMNENRESVDQASFDSPQEESNDEMNENLESVDQASFNSPHEESNDELNDNRQYVDQASLDSPQEESNDEMNENLESVDQASFNSPHEESNDEMNENRESVDNENVPESDEQFDLISPNDSDDLENQAKNETSVPVDVRKTKSSTTDIKNENSEIIKVDIEDVQQVEHIGDEEISDKEKISEVVKPIDIENISLWKLTDLLVRRLGREMMNYLV